MSNKILPAILGRPPPHLRHVIHIAFTIHLLKLVSIDVSRCRKGKDVEMRLKALEDTRKQVALSNTALPSACMYTIFNAQSK